MRPSACGGVGDDRLEPGVDFTRQTSMRRMRSGATLRAGAIGAARDNLSFVRFVMDRIPNLTSIKFISRTGLVVHNKDYVLSI
jgi:hypothetical protein